jgi:hypothetical protein
VISTALAGTAAATANRQAMNNTEIGRAAGFSRRQEGDIVTSRKPIKDDAKFKRKPGSRETTRAVLRISLAALVPRPTNGAIDRRPTHIGNAVGLKNGCSGEAAEAKNRPP